MKAISRLLAVFLPWLALKCVFAGDPAYIIDYYSIDGGGGTSTGAVYTLTGTISQPEAGGMSSASLTLEGGFWSVAAALPLLTNTLPIQPGYNLIANQLDVGSNTLSDVFPNPQDGLQLSTIDCANQEIILATYDSGIGGWVDENFNPIDPATVTLPPGKGFFYYNPGSATVLTFRGTPHFPTLPVTLPAQCYALLARQTNEVGTFENIIGVSPAEGDQVGRWTGAAYELYLYSSGTWTPAVPILANGEAARFWRPIDTSPPGYKFKADNTIVLNQAASWTNNAVPTGADFGVWDSIVAVANTTNSLGGDINWGGIKIINPGGPVTLTAGHTLTLNGVSGIGIDMSGAAKDLTVNCPVRVVSRQAWDSGSGRLLTVDSLAVDAPIQFGGLGELRINALHAEGIYPADFVGSSRTTMGAMSGDLAVTVSGSGTVVFDGTSTYTGPTTVSNGMLTVNGSLLGTGAVTVAGGTLGGNGIISGPVTVQPGATLCNGRMIADDGRITINNTLTLGGIAILGTDRSNTPNSESMVGITTLTLGGTLVVTNVGPALQAGDTFTLFAAANYTGSFAAIIPATPGIGIVWDMSHLTTDGTLRVVADTTPPLISCPSNFVVYADASQCQATVIFPVSAMDNSDPAPVLVCVPPSGSVLPVGQTNVVCTATDASGNSNTCTFTISVVPAVMGAVGATLSPRMDGAFRSVASSADGRRLVASLWGGPTYTSADYGTTWIARTIGDSFNSLASSADGTRLAAAPWTSTVRISTDAGATWTPHDVYAGWPVWNTWASIALSADGNKLVVVENGGYVYTSTDSGVTWIRRDSSRVWFSVGSSADGGTLVAAASAGQLYTSTDSGLTWMPRASNQEWRGVAASADGRRMVAVANNGQIYTSWDTGQTWTARDTNRSWTCVASSADGLKLVAGAYQDHLYYSDDGGVTWSPRGGTGSYWFSLALSADGTRLVAADFEGGLYTSAATITPLTNPPAFLGATNRWVAATGPSGAVATYTVTATNYCQPNVPVTCTPPSGSLFPLGTNTVTCVAVDALGSTNTTTFSIVVRNLPPPELSQIQFTVGLGGLNLTWAADQGWILQQASTLTGPWNDVSTTTNSYQIVPTGPGQYYRLKLGP